MMARSAVAQDRTNGTVVGRVTTSGRPVADAVIVLDGTARRASTDTWGVFRISIPRTRVVLQVRRLGFVPFERVVEASEQGEVVDTLRIALVPVANALRTLSVRADRDHPFAAVSTGSMLRNAPPLGEADVFRTLALLPAVSQPNDAVNRLHLAGGASDEHRVTLDGHPLQSPFHLASLFGAFNVAALDRAELRMHHLPSATDGYLSGEIALVSKQVAREPSREATLSLLSASATVAQPVGADGGVLVSARSTYIDRVLAAYSRETNQRGDDLLLPGFFDVMAKWSVGRIKGWHTELLGYASRDRVQLRDPRPGERPAAWGETLLGASTSYRGRNWELSSLLSGNRSTVTQTAVYTPAGADTGRLTEANIDQRWLTAQVGASYLVTSAVRLRADVSVRRREHEHRWEGDFARTALSTPLPPRLDTTTQQTVTGLGLEADLVPSRDWRATVGSHIAAANGKAYAAPRLLLSHQVAPSFRLDAAWNRRYQWDAIAGEPAAFTATQPIFFLATPRQADVASLSADWERAPIRDRALRLSATLTGYARWYRDRTISRIALPGADDPYGYPAAAIVAGDSVMSFARVPGNTVGATLSTELGTARGLVARVSYTAQRARETADGRIQPTAWDAPHQLALFTSVPLTRRLGVTSALQLRSGTAITPVAARIFVPIVRFPGGYGSRYLYGAPNSAQLPTYARLDIGARYGWRARGADWVFSLQAINALARVNGLAYDQASYFACVSRPDFCVDGGASARSLPLVPSVGLEVRW